MLRPLDVDRVGARLLAHAVTVERQRAINAGPEIQQVCNARQGRQPRVEIAGQGLQQQVGDAEWVVRPQLVHASQEVQRQVGHAGRVVHRVAVVELGPLLPNQFRMSFPS